MASIGGLAFVFVPGQAYKASADANYVQGTYFKASWSKTDIIALVAGDYYYVCYNNSTKVVYTGVITATAGQTLFSNTTNPINPSVMHYPSAVIKFK